VDYALTDLGLKLVVPLRALYDWAEERVSPGDAGCHTWLTADWFS